MSKERDLDAFLPQYNIFQALKTKRKLKEEMGIFYFVIRRGEEGTECSRQ